MKRAEEARKAAEESVWVNIFAFTPHTKSDLTSSVAVEVERASVLRCGGVRKRKGDSRW